jgi:hypothetical protein
LAYVIRATIAVTAEATDPQANYVSKQDELIARAPITVAGHDIATYLSDRARVWELISNLTRDQDCWSYVRPAQRARDGRTAFLGLRGHFLGANNVDNMSSRAEKRLQTTSYDGEKRRWNFEKYVKVHIDQHAILQGLVEHGYSGIDARSKVRHLVNGIKTTSLDSVKTRIMSDAALRQDFDGCVNLFQDFIEQRSSSAEPREATISAVHADKSRHSNNAEADMSVEDRYYNRAEYMKLSNEKKLGLKRKREKRGHKGPKKEAKSNGGRDKGVNLSQRSIKALATALQDDESTPATEHESESDSSGDDEVEMKAPAKKKAKTAKMLNRYNKALSRKNKQ